MGKLSFVTDSYRGEVPINWFMAKDDEKGVIAFGTPGLVAKCVLPNCTEIRGLHSYGGYLYAVAVQGNNSKVYRINSSYVATEIGTIFTNSGAMFIINNGPNGQQIMFVDGQWGYVYTIAPEAWEEESSYSYGDVIKATVDTGFFYRCIVAGTSGAQGVAAYWQKSYAYTVDRVVQPTTPNNYAYICTVAGTSGATEPTSWPTVIGNTVVDGGVTWRCIYGPNEIWATEVTYAQYKVVRPTTPNNFYYLCTVSGKSGVTEPVWPVALGQTVVDGAATWKCIRVAQPEPTWPTTLNQTIRDNEITWKCIAKGAAGGSFNRIDDTAFPGAAACTFQDGYGIYVKPGTMQWGLSSLYNFAAYSDPDDPSVALAYSSKEGEPDPLVSCISDHLELWLFGTSSTEVWHNTGASPFPFSRVPGGILEEGCGAAATPCQVDDSIYWLSSKGQVLMAKGYKPQIISTRKMDREIAGYSTISDAFGFTYTDEGHTFYQLTFPTADVTWLYDAATSLWSKKSSYPGRKRHRASSYALFNNVHLVGDYATGTIYQMSMDAYDDDGELILREIQSAEQRNEGKRVRWPDIQFVFEQGVGVQNGPNPTVSLSYSNDGGHVWSNELYSDTMSANVGAIGEYNTRSIFRKLGSSYQRIWKLAVSDRVKWVLLGADPVVRR